MRKLLINLLSTILIFLMIILVWRNTILNRDTHMTNWNDEPFVIWVIQNNLQHFNSLDFKNVYETNAMYPFKYSLSFAEHLFLPSFIVWLISLFVQNLIAQHNLLLILNHILLFFTSLLLFRQVLKETKAAILSSFYVTFSPYFFTQLGHLQMIFYWPLLLSLYLLVKFFESKKKKDLFIGGFTAGLQFLGSVYLGFMNLVIIILFFFTKLVTKELSVKKTFSLLTQLILIFLIVSAVSIYGYFLVQKTYHPQREYQEFLNYPAHLTDYLFPYVSHNSWLYQINFFQAVKRLDQHFLGEKAAFVGFFPLLILSIYLLPRIKRLNKAITISWRLNALTLYAILLVVLGLIFSLGPRLFVNGNYTGIPLPYDLLLQFFTPIKIIRALARWYFLVMLGVAILIGVGYKRIQSLLAERNIPPEITFFAILAAFIIEFYPTTPFQTQEKTWNSNVYKFLTNEICKDKGKVLLEYPFTYRNLDGDLIRDLQYKSLILLNSTQHNCQIISGYHGYEPPSYLEIKKELDNGFSLDDMVLIKKLKIDYLKFNNFALSSGEWETIKSGEDLSSLRKIYKDEESTIFDLRH